MAQFKQEWGSEVAIDGTKPDWLDASELVAIHTARDGAGSNGWYGLYQGNSDFFAREIAKDDDLIRLLAGHPHYNTPVVTTPTPDERAVAPELVARLIELAKHAAVSASGHTQDEARAIVAALEPVDEHEEVAKRILGYANNGLMSQEQRIAMIKNELRGRQLEKEGK